jgi:superfamily II DNA or RNA helicase/HKD family nuclease
MHRILYLKESVTTGFVDYLHKSNENYRPHLLTNDRNKGKKILTSLQKEIRGCDTFWISVAFVTTDGVASIINALDEFRTDGKIGKLLVSDYLGFTQPEALTKLLQFENVELRISRNRNFHAKGYLFQYGPIYNLVIGSSNLTANALSVNTEWNLKVSATAKSELIQNAKVEFDKEFTSAEVVDSAFIEAYRLERKINWTQAHQIAPHAHVSEGQESPYRPNNMQAEALKSIERLRSQQKTKALLISATGTGKTFLSAFDAKAFGAKRLLFVVHRRNIAEAAKKTFKLVFGDSISTGIYSGDKLESEKDFLFCTVQTISRQDHYLRFQPNHFDYIVVDETHRAGAESYERLLKYFQPKFTLGMTATPERTDGYDVFKLFDYNIAYEIRLQRALEEDMLAPFHYYGVTEIKVDGQEISDDAAFNLLVSEERVKHIIQKANFYGTDQGNVRGLIFCSRNQESRELSKKFNELGFKTVSLSGDNSELDRTQAIERLESVDAANRLDYIFTVDIFNEGIDIPSVNQIILLRPTQSAIVFVQQFGRGLRKADNKSYLTVIDFIGNYSNNFLVPIALYGDTSYNKDAIRKLISSGSSLVPGSSTVDFDKISRDRIFDSIDNTNLQTKKELVNDYRLLKYRIGKPPLMMDFLEHDARDPFQYVMYARSYYNFLSDMEPLISSLGKRTRVLFEHYAKEINNGKRVQDSIVLLHLIEEKRISTSAINHQLQTTFGFTLDQTGFKSVATNLNLEFATERKGAKILTIQEINNFELIKFEGTYFEADTDLLQVIDDEFAKDQLRDNVRFSIRRFENQFSPETFVKGFNLYSKYTRKDVLRILHWPKKIVDQNIGGSIINAEKTACALFINYHKAEDISSSTKYEDGFLNNHEFQWMSKSGRKLTSQDIQDLKTLPNLRICLFIKKSNDEGQEHYYFGDVTPVLDSFQEAKLARDDGRQVSVVKILFELLRPVKEAIYEYITESPVVDNNPDEKAHTVVEIRNLSQVVPYEKCLPFYNVQVAAGNFSEEQVAAPDQWITVPKDLNVKTNQFVCKVVGESMNKVIPNDSYCVFEKDEGGSRDGKIVLVASQGIQDADFGAGYTIKYYHSKKVTTPDLWGHTEITLAPSSTLGKFRNLKIEAEELTSFRVIGIFKCILEF